MAGNFNDKTIFVETDYNNIILIDPNNIDPFLEAKIMAQLSHPNIVRYHTSWLEYLYNKLYNVD